jgi:small subunit ribosomal protein S6
VRQRIDSGGTLKAENAWGMRKLAYEIRQRNEADYRFYRFETENPLLDDLNHNLKITDGVLRFRIFKVDPDSPVIEPPPPVSLAGASAGSRGPRDRRPPRGPDQPPADVAPPAEEAPAADEAPAPAAEQPAEAPPPADAEAAPAAEGEAAADTEPAAQ